jgi:membrane-associated protease RseP (regulator of RpoE activity)
MNCFTQLRQRALASGFCFALLGAGLLASAQEPAPATATKPSTEQLQQWLAELDSDSFDVREAAAEKLAQAGPAAVDVLARGIVSESAEIAWRSGASLERIALGGDEKTLARVTSVLDNLSTKGKPGLRTMAAELHNRQKHFRHDRAVAGLKKNGAVFASDGMELGGGAIFMGGAVAMPVPIMVEDAGAIEVAAEPEPAPADGIFGLLGRIFEAVKGPEVAPPVEALPPRLIVPAAPPVLPAEAPKIEPVPAEPIAEPPALEDKPAVEAKPVEKPAEEKLEQALEEFKELAEPIKEAAPADAQALAPPPALAADVDVVVGGDVAMPIALDFIGGGFVDLDEGEVETSASLMLGKQWRGGDDGLKVLKDVPEIWSISLDGAKITDAALQYMGELPNLSNLQVRNTAITRQGLRKLRDQKPELQVQARGEAMMGVNADVGNSPLVLTSIFPDSGAYQAGLRQGDMIHSVDGLAIKDFADLTISIYGRKAGEKVRVEYERDGAKKTVEVTLKKRADDQ